MRLILISALLISGGYFFLAKPALDSAEDAAVYGCVASIHQSLVDFREKSPHGTGITFDTGWRELGPPEYDRVMERVKTEGSLDSGRSYWNEEGRFVDPWGQPYHIAGRVVPGGGVEFTVWSSGRDRVSGSTDDVSSRYGERLLRYGREGIYQRHAPDRRHVASHLRQSGRPVMPGIRPTLLL